MDMLGYKEMWWQAEREGSQVTFLHRLYEALEEGQEWLFPNDSDVWPTDKDRYAIKAFTDNIVIGWPVPSSQTMRIQRSREQSLN